MLESASHVQVISAQSLHLSAPGGNGQLEVRCMSAFEGSSS
jgi:hypothetical protein